MTRNQPILDFLDGSLAPDEEAELMHRLSVSPERRALLRSYMKQSELFARDRQAIQVPYAAEQGLWQRLGTVMPVTMPAAEELAPVAAQTPVALPFFARLFTGASAAVGTVTLMLGLTAGYIFGNSNTEPSTTAFVSHQAQPSTSQLTATAIQPNKLTYTLGTSVASGSNAPAHAHHASIASFGNNAEYAASNAFTNLRGPIEQSAVLPSNRTPASVVTTDIPSNAVGNRNAFSAIDARSEKLMARFVGEDGNKPIFFHSYADRTFDKSLIQRFEFSFTESFGRQYPNSIATNNSMPLITNSAISAYFQVLPHSDAFWAGVSVGTANITKKNIFTQAGNQLDHLQEVVTSDTVHAQTGYVAGFLQYRIPATSNLEVMLTGGYGLASLGAMAIGEVGVHYDVSREVGVQMGLRGSRFTYTLTQEKANAIRSGSGSLVVPKGVDEASPSFNLEMNTGLYFHF